MLKNLGVIIEQKPSEWLVHGPQHLRAPQGDLNCGNSGTTMRLMSGVLAGQAFVSTMSGDTSLLKRPMERVADPLRRMGAHDPGSLAREALSPGQMREHAPSVGLMAPGDWPQPAHGRGSAYSTRESRSLQAGQGAAGPGEKAQRFAGDPRPSLTDPIAAVVGQPLIANSQ